MQSFVAESITNFIIYYIITKDVNREIQKLEKDNPKPEKREKNKKYQEKKKLQVNKLNRMEDTLNQAMQVKEITFYKHI